MDETIVIYPKEDDISKRIDTYISDEVKITRSAAQKLIDDGNVTIDGNIIKKNYKIRDTKQISVILPPPELLDVLPENIPLDIVYEDEYLLVVNKPKGMVVHPAAGNTSSTLVNALMYHCKDSLSSINGVIRPGIVHRIDKDTSGLLIVAKCNEAHLSLANQIKEHSFDRIYNTIATGNFKDDFGTIDAPIGRHPIDRKRMAVIKNGNCNARDARTHYSVIERFNKYTHLELKLQTGRTHQIRVHLSSIGHPVIGDTVYKPNQDKFEKTNSDILKGQCLHAKVIGFTHPITGERLYFDSPLPEYFNIILEKLRKMC